MIKDYYLSTHIPTIQFSIRAVHHKYRYVGDFINFPANQNKL